jgi:hypothetical protein
MKELEKAGQDNENLEAIHNNYNSIKGFFEYIMTIYDYAYEVQNQAQYKSWSNSFFGHFTV